MKIHDISMQIESNMLVYKDKEEKRPVFTNMANHDEGAHYETNVSLDIHCGTHIDMPLHMIRDGKSLDTFDITRLLTPCKVFDMTYLQDPVISAKDIKDLSISEDDFIIFKTTNSSYTGNKFDTEYVYVDRSAASMLRDIGVNGVGIDALGIERAQDDHMTHRLLLGDDIIILEGLVLGGVKQGEYELVALPIKLKGTEGSWVRAVLIER